VLEFELVRRGLSGSTPEEETSSVDSMEVRDLMERLHTELRQLVALGKTPVIVVDGIDKMVTKSSDKVCYTLRLDYILIIPLFLTFYEGQFKIK